MLVTKLFCSETQRYHKTQKKPSDTLSESQKIGISVCVLILIFGTILFIYNRSKKVPPTNQNEIPQVLSIDKKEKLMKQVNIIREELQSFGMVFSKYSTVTLLRKLDNRLYFNKIRFMNINYEENFKNRQNIYLSCENDLPIFIQIKKEDGKNIYYNIYGYFDDKDPKETTNNSILYIKSFTEMKDYNVNFLILELLNSKNNEVFKKLLSYITNNDTNIHVKLPTRDQNTIDHLKSLDCCKTLMNLLDQLNEDINKTKNGYEVFFNMLIKTENQEKFKQFCLGNFSEIN